METSRCMRAPKLAIGFADSAAGIGAGQRIYRRTRRASEPPAWSMSSVAVSLPVAARYQLNNSTSLQIERDYLHVPIAQARSESVPGRCPGVTYPYHLVLKRGIDEVVLLLTANGLMTGEVAAHFADVYGATVSKDTISRIRQSILPRWPSGATGRWSPGMPWGSSTPSLSRSTTAKSPTDSSTWWSGSPQRGARHPWGRSARCGTAHHPDLRSPSAASWS
jgi:hypothetical protein